MAWRFLTLVLFSTAVFCENLARHDVQLSTIFFDGGYLFFPVKRTKLQQYLDKVNYQFQNDDVNLLLPSKPILQDIIAADEHVIAVGFGNMTALAFDNAFTDSDKEQVSIVDEAFGSMIPYLTSKVGASADVTLQMTPFTARGDFVKAQAILPPGILADRLVRITDGSHNEIQFDKDDMNFHAIGDQEQCDKRNEHVTNDVQELEHELQISLNGPDFSICDRFPDIEVDFCDVYRDPYYNSLLKQAGNNVCLYLEPTSDVENCKVSFHVQSMSQSMRERFLLEEAQDVVEAGVQKGTFTTGLVFPCM